MKIQIRESQFEINGKAEVIMGEIESHLTTKGLFLNSLIIDEKEVYDDFETHLQTAERVEVIAFTTEELVTHFWTQWQEEGQELCRRAEELSLVFYKNMQTADSWEELAQILERGYGLLQPAENILYLQGGHITEETIEQLKKILQLFTVALEEKDEIYLADLLHFELAVFLGKKAS